MERSTCVSPVHNEGEVPAPRDLVWVRTEQPSQEEQGLGGTGIEEQGLRNRDWEEQELRGAGIEEQQLGNRNWEEQGFSPSGLQTGSADGCWPWSPSCCSSPPRLCRALVGLEPLLNAERNSAQCKTPRQRQSRGLVRASSGVKQGTSWRKEARPVPAPL